MSSLCAFYWFWYSLNCHPTYCVRAKQMFRSVWSIGFHRQAERESIYLNSSSVNIFIFEGKIEIRTFKSRCLKINFRRRTATADCYLLSIFLWLANERTNKQQQQKKKTSVICCFWARHANSLGTCTSICIYAVQVDSKVLSEYYEVNDRKKRYFQVGNIFVWTMTQYIPMAHLSSSISF